MLVQEIFPDHELLIVPSAGLFVGCGEDRRFFSIEKGAAIVYAKVFLKLRSERSSRYHRRYKK